jgi:hypothetical protein
MLPKPNDFPTLLAQKAAIARIPSSVAFYLDLPLLGKLVSPIGEPPAVPEVPIHKDGQLHETKYKVRSAGKVAGMAFPFEVTLGETAGDQEFRPGVFASNSRHHTRTSLGGHDVAPVLSRSSFDCRDGLPSDPIA